MCTCKTDGYKEIMFLCPCVVGTQCLMTLTEIQMKAKGPTIISSSMVTISMTTLNTMPTIGIKHNSFITAKRTSYFTTMKHL